MSRPFISMDDPKQAEDFANLIDDLIRGAADNLIRSQRMSPISALAMIYQGAVRGLVYIGGEGAFEYSDAVVGQFKDGEVTDELRAAQTEAFKRMAAHADLLAKTPEGSA